MTLSPLSPASPPSDEELVTRSRTGDTDSFNQLVKRWERPIFALAYRTLGRETSGGLRIGFAHYNTAAEVERLLALFDTLSAL